MKLSFTGNYPVSRKTHEFGVKGAKQHFYKLEELKGLLKLPLHHFDCSINKTQLAAKNYIKTREMMPVFSKKV